MLKMKMHKSKRKCQIILLILLFVGTYAQAGTSIKEWQEDIDVYARELSSRHIDAFHTLSQISFLKEVARIRAGVAEKTGNQLLVELMRLTRKINDGHTSFPLWGWENSNFPLGFKIYDDEVYVVSTTAEFQDLLGARLLSINGVPTANVVDLISQLTPFTENDFSAAVRTAQYLPNANVLSGLGVVSDINRAEFAFDVDGSEVAHLFEARQAPQLDFHISHLNDKLFSPLEKITDDLWFAASSDKKTIYIKFRRYTPSSSMESFATKALAFINQHQSDNLIIDLRDNFGGDFFVGLKLAQFLVLADTIDWKDGVYVLIDNVTFSAAMSNAAQFSQILNAKLIGSPTGARPSGYQDMGQFVLPNSRLEVTYSKRLYHFKEDGRNALYPDVSVEVSIDDIKNSYDSQLRWVLDHINKRPAFD